MNNKLNAVVGALIALVVALGVTYFVQPTSTTITKVIKEVKKSDELGSVVGPDFYGPYWSVNDVQKYYLRTTLASSWTGTEGTTTPCRIQAPLSGTSTLSHGFVQVNEHATSSFIEMGKAEAATKFGNIFATTTLIGNKYDLAANTKVDINASSSTHTSNNIFGPGDWFVVRFGGGANQRPTGTCEVEFTKF